MIKFEDVHKTYKSGVDALRGVNFTIDDGEFVFVIGKSGSGKSTLMKCITCEETPSSGVVSIDGFDISNMSRKLVPVLRRQLGMIYQDFRLIESKTVFENIAFAGEIIGMPRKSLNQSVQLVLNIVGLKDKANAYPQELSGGEQQRVAIARAMVSNPRIIVADEPTGNLDPETSENIMALLLDINKSGTTVLVCTHDANLVDRMKKRVIEIDSGLVARDEYDSSYSGSEPAKKVSHEPIKNDNVGFSFGDDPNFENDNDYHTGYDDDEQYQIASNSITFNDEPVPANAVIPVDIMPAVITGIEDIPVEEVETVEEVEEAAVAEITEEVEDIPELPAVTEEALEDSDSQKMTEEEKEYEEEIAHAAGLVFGQEDKQIDTGDEANTDASDDENDSDSDEEIESYEEWMNSVDVVIDESDIDLDISEDD